MDVERACVFLKEIVIGEKRPAILVATPTGCTVNIDHAAEDFIDSPEWIKRLTASAESRGFDVVIGFGTVTFK